MPNVNMGVQVGGGFHTPSFFDAPLPVCYTLVTHSAVKHFEAMFGTSTHTSTRMQVTVYTFLPTAEAGNANVYCMQAINPEKESKQMKHDAAESFSSL